MDWLCVTYLYHLAQLDNPHLYPLSIHMDDYAWFTSMSAIAKAKTKDLVLSERTRENRERCTCGTIEVIIN